LGVLQRRVFATEQQQFKKCGVVIQQQQQRRAPRIFFPTDEKKILKIAFLVFRPSV